MSAPPNSIISTLLCGFAADEWSALAAKIDPAEGVRLFSFLELWFFLFNITIRAVNKPTTTIPATETMIARLVVEMPSPDIAVALSSRLFSDELLVEVKLDEVSLENIDVDSTVVVVLVKIGLEVDRGEVLAGFNVETGGGVVDLEVVVSRELELNAKLEVLVSTSSEVEAVIAVAVVLG